MTAEVNTDWAGLVFEESFMRAVDKLAVRRFGEGTLAEEAATYVIEYLSDNDWEKCRGFQGKSQPGTFLFTLCGNAIEEYSRKRFGRPRPPTWLQELGELWIKLWRSLCLERQLLPAIVDRFARAGFREPSQVEQAARVIKARIPNCGQSHRDSVTVDDIDSVSDAAQSAADNPCDDCGSDTDNPFHAELLMMVKAIADPAVNADHFGLRHAERRNALAERHRERMEMLRDALALTDQEAVMLRMIYVEGLSKTVTSKALGLPAHQAGRMVNNVLQRIGDALRRCDIELDTLLELA